MAANEPPYLPVGTDVSAKYRGAFCEAKVKKLVRSVKCKVVLKESQTSIIVNDDSLKGPLKIGASVEIKHPETGQIFEALVSKLTDQSMYTVVFDDGDEKTLRRTQLCLKGEKHFIESETLDNLPLSHPEHFGTPVLQTKSRKRTAKIGSPGFNTLYLAQEDTESDESDSEDSSPKRAMYRGKHQELVSKVMVLDSGDKRKSVSIPVLVVLPDAANIDLKTKDHILVKSFKDGKFLSVLKKDLKDFTRDTAIKNEDKALKTAFEKALLYFDNHELPSAWKRDELLGSEDEEDFEEEDSSDDEPSEEKDRFVAQLYKFMDDRGTPINKGPSIGNRDLNLYKLFRVVQNLGGYNRVTNQMKWRLVYSKMGLPQSNTASHQIKNAYKKFLHAFEDFYRKLGSTMGTISRPGRSRHNSGRSILPFRGRDKESPKSPRSVKSKDSDKDDSDRGKSRSDGDSQSEDGKDAEEESKEEVSTGKEESDSEPPRKLTPRRMLRDDLKEAKEKEKEAKRKKEEKEEQAKQKKEEEKSKKEEKDEGKSKKEEKEESKGKKEDKKSADEDRKLRGGKQEDKSDSKKDEPKSDRETRGQKEKQKEETKVEKEKTKKKDKEKEKEKDKEKEEEKEDESKEDEKSGKKQRVTRRKSGRADEVKKESDDKSEETEEKKSDDKKSDEKKVDDKKVKKEETGKGKKEDKKEAKKEEKKDKKEDKKEEKKKEEKPKEKKGKEKVKPQEDEESAEEEAEEPEITLRPREEYPTGTKLKVRYGRGRNQKIYEAKVVESNKDGSHKTYLVHYAGWNTRYDEWVKPDRIIAVVDKPDVNKQTTKKIVSPKTPSPKQASATLLKKRGRVMPGGSSPNAGTSSAEFRTPPPKSRSPVPVNTAATKTRPTRSNSLDNQVVEGLPPKRLTRRSSGITESSDSVSHASDESETEEVEETEQKTGAEEQKLVKDESESDQKESEHDTSLEEEPQMEEETENTVEEKDVDLSQNAGSEVAAVEEDSILQCTEEMLKSEEEDIDAPEDQSSMEAKVVKVIEKLEEEIPVGDKQESFFEVSKPEPPHEKDSEKDDKVLEKDSAPELVAEKPFKETLPEFDSKSESVMDEAKFEASEVLLQMPILHEVFHKSPEELKALSADGKKQESPPMPEIKKIEPDVLKGKEGEKKGGRKLKRDLKEGKKPKADGPEGKKLRVCEPAMAEQMTPQEMTPQEARRKAAMDLYDFQGFEEPEALVLRREKKTDLPGRRLLTLEKDVTKPEVPEVNEMEKKKVKKKVKRKDVEGKKESEVDKDELTEVKKEVEKKEEVKKDTVKESAKGKGLKGEKGAKKDSKKVKEVKVEGEGEVGGEKKRSRSPSPVDSCSKVLKTEQVYSSPKPSTSSEPVSAVKEAEESSAVSECAANVMLENTPPTTPEHEAEDGNTAEPVRTSEEQAEPMQAEQLEKSGSVWPAVGEASASSVDSNENNSAVPSSESSNDVEAGSPGVGKRKRDSLDHTPSKRKKRVSKGGKAGEKKKAVQGSDSDETCTKQASPVHTPGPSSPMKIPEGAQVIMSRPPKYNFNLEEGKYFEGEKRIAFLYEKMQEIRKIYMNLKQEVACIDRRRKRHKRKEKEHSSSQMDMESS